MPKKIVLSLGFVFIVTSLLVGCPDTAPQPTPELGNATPSSLNFDLLVGQDSTNEFSFTNTGDADLDYTLSESEDLLSLSRTNGTLGPEETETITVTVTCSAEGNVSGTIDIDAGDAGSDSVLVTLTCEEPPLAGDFNIELEFVGIDFNASRRAAFTSAAARWSEIILNDLGDIEGLVKEEGECSPDPDVPDEPAFEGDIDDLYIVALLADIDGLSGILAQAGPCFVRTDATQLPIYGVMIFDTADVEDLEASRIFDKVILHEMGHVLGIGTYWGGSLFDATCPSSGDVGFTGASAVREFGRLGETGNPPVETDGGTGTQCGHWDEDFFDNELMTGFLGGVNAGVPLSRLTIASLEDIGYTIDISQGESYSVPLCSPDCDPLSLKSQSNALPLNEILLTPRGFVDADGEVELFRSDR